MMNLRQLQNYYYNIFTIIRNIFSVNKNINPVIPQAEHIDPSNIELNIPIAYVISEAPVVESTVIPHPYTIRMLQERIDIGEARLNEIRQNLDGVARIFMRDNNVTYDEALQQIKDEADNIRINIANERSKIVVPLIHTRSALVKLILIAERRLLYLEGANAISKYMSRNMISEEDAEMQIEQEKYEIHKNLTNYRTELRVIRLDRNTRIR